MGHLRYRITSLDYNLSDFDLADILRSLSEGKIIYTCQVDRNFHSANARMHCLNGIECEFSVIQNLLLCSDIVSFSLSFFFFPHSFCLIIFSSYSFVYVYNKVGTEKLFIHRLQHNHYIRFSTHYTLLSRILSFQCTLFVVLYFNVFHYLLVLAIVTIHIVSALVAIVCYSSR